MEDTVKCTGHNLPARIYTSHSLGNPGRLYYNCPKERGDPDRCGFFAWVTPDPPAARNNLPPTPLSEHPNRPNTQTAPPSTPHSSQTLKRTFSAVDNSGQPEETPRASQKRTRIEEIEQALAEVQRYFLPFFDKASQTQAQVQNSQAGPSSQPSRNNGAALQDPFSNRATGGTWPPQTPPRPSRENAAAGPAVSPSPSPVVADAAREPPVRTESNADVENSSQVTLSDEEGLSGDSIAKMVQRLQGLPEYVRKLERQKVAAERSRDAKETKIIHLQAEVARLQAREKELEGVIDAYEASK